MCIGLSRWSESFKLSVGKKLHVTSAPTRWGLLRVEETGRVLKKYNPQKAVEFIFHFSLRVDFWRAF